MAIEHLFIVVYRESNGQWRAKSDGIFTERRVADNFKEICQLRDTEPKYEYFVVEGSILPAELEF